MSIDNSDKKIIVDRQFIHDVNNYLFGASSQLEMLLNKLDKDSKMRPYAEKSMESILGAKRLLNMVNGERDDAGVFSGETDQAISRKDMTVMVMDDDEIILESMDEYLNENGYDVMLAANEEQALKIIKSKHEDIDIAILDLNIPEGPGGVYVLEELKKINPQIKVIISSGYIPQDIEENIKQIDPLCKTLKKPFRFSQIKEVLNYI